MCVVSERCIPSNKQLSEDSVCFVSQPDIPERGSPNHVYLSPAALCIINHDFPDRHCYNNPNTTSDRQYCAAT